jgi:serine phosphatase RsbU (regulator of sigma subunit)
LGSLSSCQYKQRELVIAPGDVIVLMSDGLPERFNAENEMLDYAATRRALAVAAHQTPQEIIEHFVSVGDEWSNGHPQDDDVTFVVLKVMGKQNGLADALPVKINDN